MKKSGELLASIHEQLRDFIKPGITGHEIDQFVEKKIIENGGIPAQIGYEGYKYATCISVNDEICHGFPRKKPLENGDIVTIDMVVNLNGGLADSAWSYAVGDIDEKGKQLMDVTKKALYLGIEQAQEGNRIGDIGHAIQTYAENENFSVVREFTGHGIGPTLHEAPHIPHFGEPNKGIRLKEGMVITIEPMINEGAWQSKMDDNGWTARTIDGGRSCQYEHTLAITKDGPLIITEQDE